MTKIIKNIDATKTFIYSNDINTCINQFELSSYLNDTDTIIDYTYCSICLDNNCSLCSLYEDALSIADNNLDDFKTILRKQGYSILLEVEESTWAQTKSGVVILNSFDIVLDKISNIRNIIIELYYQSDGTFLIIGHHHDGFNYYKGKLLNKRGENVFYKNTEVDTIGIIEKNINYYTRKINYN